MTVTIKKSLLSFLYITSLLLSMFSCKKELPNQENKNEEEKAEKEVIPKLQDVYLFGASNNVNDLESVSLLDFSLLAGLRAPHYTKEMRGDTLEIKLPGITQSQIIELMSFGESDFYNTRLLIHPEDSIYFHLENGKVTFSKTRSSENNFFENITTPETQWPNFNGDVSEYKKDIEAMRDTRKKIFDTYVKEHSEVSKTFIDMVHAEMKYEYLLQLANPRSITHSSTASISNFNNVDGLLSTLQSSQYDFEKGMLDLASYYDQVTIEDFQKPEYINNDYFKRSLTQLIRHYFAEYEYLNYSKETFLAEKEFITKNLDGELKTYALGRLIYDYNKKGFGRGAKDLEIMRTSISEFKSRTDKDLYLENIHTIETALEIMESGIPNHILTEKLLTTTLDTITVGELLQSTKGNIRTIDFWASWCAPCIKEMKTTKTFKDELATQYGADWIYISADEIQENWIKKTKKLQPYIPEDKHYRFVYPFKSKLLKILKARDKNKIYVPRYTILDSDNNVALAIAPFPSDSITFKKNIQEIVGE
ncbi:thioredoxin-like domain-containing protein [Dokdonia sp.]|uniref:TlpA family protein disulfide reductase n=1 Tax=Dokdonia sp. TaxID=2024995 RepID=UPI0032636C79